jgi:tetratricopeptide (TPR) repeat protein
MENKNAVRGYSDAEQRRQLSQARRLSEKSGQLLLDGRVKEALLCQAEVAALCPNTPVAFFRLGVICRKAGRTVSAVDAFRRAVFLAPELREQREALMEALLEASRYAEVIVEAKDMLQIFPRSLFTFDMLCVAYLQIGRIEKAVQVTGEMILLDPHSPAHHFKRAMLFQQQGNLKFAMAEYARAMDLAAPDSEVYEDAGEALRMLDEFQAHQIISLASDDRLFRWYLRQNTAQAIDERGFCLSDEGLSRMQMLMHHQFLDTEGTSSRASWGGVRYYN